MNRAMRFASCIALMMTFTAVHADPVHLFYMHGVRMDGGGGKEGEKAGYNNILQEFRKKGFDVLSEVRGHEGVNEYALKIAKQVNDLIASGVAPSDIVVSGYSKGAVISLIAASIIKNKEVRYVALAGCTDRFEMDYAEIQGKVLSIYDRGDHKFGSCEDHISNSDVVSFDEVSLNSGHGHKIFKLKKLKFIKKWMESMVSWIEQ